MKALAYAEPTEQSSTARKKELVGAV